MGSYTFFSTIPIATNPPSVDQPNMTTNNVSNAAIWTQDHIGFNSANGGTHLQVTILSPTTPSAQTGTNAIIYTKAGLANSSSADATTINSAGSFPLGIIRAAGSYLNTGVTQNMIQYFNCNQSAVYTSGTTSYAITLDTGVVTGNNVIVFTSRSASGLSDKWSFAGGILTITANTLNPSTITTFVVIQI